MATQDLVTAIQALNMAESLSRSSEQGARVQLVDTLQSVQSLVDTMSSSQASVVPLCLDLEGVNLSRHGTISFIQIWIHMLEQAFLVDVHTLGARAFEVSDSKGNTLRTILESETTQKYFFDVRNDSDALYALFGIQLAGVKDVQLLELASRRGPKHILNGLGNCIEQAQFLEEPALQKWQSTKQKVVKMFDSKNGGSYEIWNVRPLPQELIDYCVGDVRFLPILVTTYESRLNAQWSERASVETVKRLQESRSPGYRPKGKHKLFGPKRWRFPPPPRDARSSTTVTSLPATGSRPATQEHIPIQHAVK